MAGNSKLKRIVTVGLLTGLLVPFILQTDLYPFFRYGMFAEPVRHEVQTERFVVMVINNKTGRMPLEPLQVGIHQSTFDYLLRNYYYRGQQALFLKKLTGIWPENFPADSLNMIRVVGKKQTKVESIPFPSGSSLKK